jgi:hypothetical protein
MQDTPFGAFIQLEMNCAMIMQLYANMQEAFSRSVDTEIMALVLKGQSSTQTDHLH